MEISIESLLREIEELKDKNRKLVNALSDLLNVTAIGTDPVFGPSPEFLAAHESGQRVLEQVRS